MREGGIKIDIWRSGMGNYHLHWLIMGISNRIGHQKEGLRGLGLPHHRVFHNFKVPSD